MQPTALWSTTELIEFAEDAKDLVKAACTEAIQRATGEKPSLVYRNPFYFLSSVPNDATLGIKRESARAIANVAQLFTGRLDKATGRIIGIAQSHGTVVWWSAACALSKILRAATDLKQELLPAISNVGERETERSTNICLLLLKWRSV
jgi:hypothetical protein